MRPDIDRTARLLRGPIIFQDNSLDDRLTADQNLYIHALLYDLPRDAYKTRADALLSVVDLTDRRKSLVRTYSGGMRRRLESARGLLHRPRVLFLDEPTVGLDLQTRCAMWQHVLRARDESDVTVFMTTHYLEEAEHCDRIAIIDHGRVVALGSPEELNGWPDEAAALVERGVARHGGWERWKDRRSSCSRRSSATSPSADRRGLAMLHGAWRLPFHRRRSRCVSRDAWRTR